MKYLQDSYNLAEARGYLKYPELLKVKDKMPNWLLSLGTDTGLADFKDKFELSVPPSLQEFYSCLPLVCFLEMTIDGNVFLVEFDEETELPLVVNWLGTKHLAFACHGHSGSVCAARLETDEQNDPLVFWGFDDEDEPFEDDRPSITFSEWIFNCVNGYDTRLEYWLNFYKDCKSNPAKERRLGSAEWVRKMPGMAEKLKKENL